MVLHSASSAPSKSAPLLARSVARLQHPAPVRKRAKAAAEPGTDQFHYDARSGMDAYIVSVSSASPMDTVELERIGVQGDFIKDLARRMDVTAVRIFAILGVPKATAEKRAAAGERIDGAPGQAAVGLIRLLGMAQAIVENSTSPEATGFDAPRWLGLWMERPQPALGGRRPADLIDTPAGVQIVTRLLGAIESGAYL